MRLDKLIAHTSAYSRKEVRYLLRAERITVNGVAVKKADHAVTPEDEVALDGQPLGWPGPRYFMLHKPEGYVCVTKDGSHPTVIELLAEPNEDKLHIAGRLDIDTTGLVLITDDGQWSHRVTSPNHHHPKCYFVETADPIPESAIAQFEKGLLLSGEKQKTKPAQLEILSPHEARLTISEGRYHQVKRMFGALGNRVERLHRESVGSIILDENLEPGEYRPLTPAEIESV